VSDLESNTDSQDHSLPKDDSLPDLRVRRRDAAGPNVQREGLPEGYRMRADTHYVEHLSARGGGPLIRSIPTQSIDGAGESLGHAELDPLIRSIKTLGVVQPLLVRKRDARYTVIGGRKRLAAAQFAGLAAVPCLIHQVTEAEAEALAQADNLRYTASSALQQHALAGEVADDLRRQLTTHLATVQTASSLLASGESVAAHVGLDLVRAHAARAAWLLEATELLTNNPVRHRFTRMLASVVEQVLDTVGPDSRLVRAQIRAHFADNAASISVEDNTVAVGLTGAIVALLALVAQTEAPTISVKAGSADGSAITLEIAATPIVLPEAKASRFFDQTWTDRPGGWPALIGAWAARAAAEQRGGSASFRVDAHGSGFVKLLLPEIVRDPKG
jgi:ParB family transcriptional regulator, chromosome partitioning protein